MPRGIVANGPDKGAYIDYPGTTFNIVKRPHVLATSYEDVPVKMHTGYNSYKFNGSMWVHISEKKDA